MSCTVAGTSGPLRGWQGAAHTVCDALEILSMVCRSATRDLCIAEPAELSPLVPKIGNDGNELTDANDSFNCKYLDSLSGWLRRKLACTGVYE